MSSERKYQQAKKIVKKKKGFYSHLSVFIATGVFFLLMNLATRAPWEEDFWFYIPMIPWSLGLIIHYFSIFGLPGKDKILSKEWEEREIQKEMYKLGGEVEDDYLDLNEKKILQKQKPTNWQDSDFV